MPRTKPNETSIQLILPVEAKKALETMAKIEELPSVSELVRQLLGNYCHHNGLDVDFSVAGWGGQRDRANGGTVLKSQEADESLTPTDVKIVGDKLQVTLADGRVIAHPLAWYPWLSAATPEQFANRVMNAIGIYWDDLGEGLSIETLLKGPERKLAVKPA
ncbi:MAG: DUF2442 domain-containing protein [Aggregatilineales bacterium]